jgi:hypothetical protein
MGQRRHGSAASATALGEPRSANSRSNVQFVTGLM